MSNSNTSGERVESRHDLVAFLEKGCKPKANWTIGTEHEKFGFQRDTLMPLEYGGARGVKAMLEGLLRFGWQPVMEGDNIIALLHDGASITLEPGGQFELSGATLKNLHQTCDEVHTHLAQVKEVADEINAGFIGLGVSPKWAREEVPIMPKGRYDIMRSYMPKKGNLGLDMMLRSCTIQTNLDFGSEADMVQKFRVGLALQPVATALFANSPFLDGKPNGFLSYRSHIWTDTDPDRTGMLPFVFEEGFGFEAYVDYALDVPMYFIHRGDTYHDVSGLSFRDFLEGKLQGFEGEKPTMDDWADHLTTLFPEVRIKQYMEVRGADGGPWARICALPALWVGLMYDSTALDAAWDLTKDWSLEEREQLRADVPQAGLKAKIRGHSMLDLAKEVLAISCDGLIARAALDGFGEDETHYLNALRTIVENGRTPAEDLLQAFEAEWGGNIDRIFAEHAY